MDSPAALVLSRAVSRPARPSCLRGSDLRCHSASLVIANGLGRYLQMGSAESQRWRDDNKNNFLRFWGGGGGVLGGGIGGREENRPKRCFSWETPRQ